MSMFKSVLLVLWFMAQGAFAKGVSPYFYEIRGGQSPPSYLLGTMHYGIRLQDVHAQVPLRLIQARLVYFETLVPHNRVELWFKNPAQAMLESPEIAHAQGAPLLDLEKRFLEEAYRLPRTITEVAHTRSCPMIFGALIAATSTPMLDRQLMRLAYAQNKQIRGLDTFALRAQALAIDQAANAAPEESLTLDPFSSSCDLRRTIQMAALEDWIVGEADLEDYKMGRLVPDTSPGTILRNRSWIRDLKDELDKGSLFIAIGVSHLLGKQSVIDLLRDQGFGVRRVP